MPSYIKRPRQKVANVLDMAINQYHATLVGFVAYSVWNAAGVVRPHHITLFFSGVPSVCTFCTIILLYLFATTSGLGVQRLVGCKCDILKNIVCLFIASCVCINTCTSWWDTCSPCTFCTTTVPLLQPL